MRRETPFKIEWDAHEYEHKERGADWFWATGIITLSIATVSVILGNIIFAIFILVAVFALSLFPNRPPQTVHVVVNEKGVARGNVVYPYSSLKSFWIDIEHSHPKVILRSRKLLMPLIVVPLDTSVNIDRLHEKLSEYLVEEYHTLPLMEKAIEYLGF